MSSTTTILVEKSTHGRFFKNKSQYEAEQGRTITADSFLNELLQGYEIGRQVVTGQNVQSGE
jgi:hypothetical protein